MSRSRSRSRSRWLTGVTARRGLAPGDDLERALAQHRAEVRLLARAVGGPDEPCVGAPGETERSPVVPPALVQLQLRSSGPAAEDLASLSVQLDVVEARLLHGAPHE